MSRFSLLACLITVVMTPWHLEAQDAPRGISCEGIYPHHLQGFCTDEKGMIYWSFTTTLVKTDPQGKVLTKISVGNHHGGLCQQDGKLYVAVNFGPFNDPDGKADSWVYVYKASTLALLRKHKTPELIYGAGGMACHDGKFIVIGGLPETLQENYLYQYDQSFKFLKKHVLKTGYTELGIQTAAFIDGHWWFGCYGNKLLKTDSHFQLLGKYDIDAGLGIAGGTARAYWIARGTTTKGKGCTGRILPATADKTKGLILRAKSACR